MGGLRILITNNTLAQRAGTELYVRDLATSLLRRGHKPIAYSTKLGEVAEELRVATIPVIDNLNALAAPPDIIHGHHHLETMAALLRFPTVPAIYFCHGWLPWEEAPPRFPRILRYVAVDHTCRDRLTFEHAIAEEKIRVLLNFVDLERFKPRAALPTRPQRALIISNQASEYTHVAAVREACSRYGITLDVIGSNAGTACSKPEEILGNYDLVFAKARSALEALAVGTTVILCDALGVGPMVNTREMDTLRQLNFGIRTLRDPISPDILARQIANYDPSDAAVVSQRIRASAGMNEVVDEILSLYQEVISEHASLKSSDLLAELSATSDYLQSLNPILKKVHTLDTAANQAAGERRRLEQQMVDSTSERHRLEQQLAASEGERRRLEQQTVALQTQLQSITSSFGWRVLSRYGPIKHRFVLPAYKRLKGLWKR